MFIHNLPLHINYNHRTVKLSAYKNQNVLLKLPDGKKLRDIKWIAVWCRKFAVSENLSFSSFSLFLSFSSFSLFLSFSSFFFSLSLSSSLISLNLFLSLFFLIETCV